MPSLRAYIQAVAKLYTAFLNSMVNFLSQKAKVSKVVFFLISKVFEINWIIICFLLLSDCISWNCIIHPIIV